MDIIKIPDHIRQYIVTSIDNPDIYKNMARYVMDISEIKKIELAILVARFEVLYAILTPKQP